MSFMLFDMRLFYACEYYGGKSRNKKGKNTNMDKLKRVYICQMQIWFARIHLLSLNPPGYCKCYCVAL